ncbi:HCaRG protein [Tritrichomonas foetus]|uniref:HCaRG protein n=1 Tax=Tritrichomonas foetus TaxID=1144522 RepID=A0A1J4KUW8_9EUKA|nr:HCaRG protein [Tritrichomonas foetus]|eukprot:OHT13317.1 HCaRG protein [Tritrichomonas foetus]
MLSQQQIRENLATFSTVAPEDLCQICNVVLDSLQFQSNLSSNLAQLEISDPATRQMIADTLNALVFKLLSSRSAATDSADQLQSSGLSAELAKPLGDVISSRIDVIAKSMASRSQADRLSDLEWRFGLTASSNNGSGSAFVQMRLSFENAQPVSVEMGMKEFYEFASDIKKIQKTMAATLGVE